MALYADLIETALVVLVVAGIVVWLSMWTEEEDDAKDP